MNDHMNSNMEYMIFKQSRNYIFKYHTKGEVNLISILIYEVK